MLVLGRDAPPGGPTKLLRKVFFIPPERNCVPRTYTAGIDLKHGVNVVAIYGEAVMLYSVAPDILMDSRHEEETTSATSTMETAQSATKLTSDHWRTWWSDRVSRHATNSTKAKASTTLWPIFISGIEIGKLEGIYEISVQTRPDLAIWAFTNSLRCQVWRLRNYVNPVVRTKHFICRDGGMHDLPSAVDGYKDIIMGGTLASPHMCPGSPCDRQQQQTSVPSFDGHDSGYMERLPRALAIENNNWVDFLDVRSCSDAWYDGDGDVVMYYRP